MICSKKHEIITINPGLFEIAIVYYNTDINRFLNVDFTFLKSVFAYLLGTENYLLQVYNLV